MENVWVGSDRSVFDVLKVFRPQAVTLDEWNWIQRRRLTVLTETHRAAFVVDPSNSLGRMGQDKL